MNKKILTKTYKYDQDYFKYEVTESVIAKVRKFTFYHNGEKVGAVTITLMNPYSVERTLEVYASQRRKGHGSRLNEVSFRILDDHFPGVRQVHRRIEPSNLGSLKVSAKSLPPTKFFRNKNQEIVIITFLQQPEPTDTYRHLYDEQESDVKNLTELQP